MFVDEYRYRILPLLIVVYLVRILLTETVIFRIKRGTNFKAYDFKTSIIPKRSTWDIHVNSIYALFNMNAG